MYFKKIIIAVLLCLFVFTAGTSAYADSATAISGQSQGQNISGLSPSASVGDLSPSAEVDISGLSSSTNVGDLISNSFNSGESKRGFAIPGISSFSFLPFPQYLEMVEKSPESGTTKYFGPRAHSWQFRPITEILSYGKVICIEQLERMAGDQWWKGWCTRDPKIFVTPVDPREPTGKYMLLLDTRPKYAYTRLGYVTSTAINDSTLSERLTARGALAAYYELGANVVYFPSEGAERRSDPKGVGVNGSHAHSTINGGGEATGNVSTGLLGFSYGSSGYFDRPWQQLTAFYIDPELLPFPDNEEGDILSNQP